MAKGFTLIEALVLLALVAMIGCFLYPLVVAPARQRQMNEQYAKCVKWRDVDACMECAKSYSPQGDTCRMTLDRIQGGM